MTNLARSAAVAYNLSATEFPCVNHPTIPSCCFISSCLLFDDDYSDIPHDIHMLFISLTFDIFLISLAYTRDTSSLKLNVDAFPLYSIFILTSETSRSRVQ